MGKIHGVKVSGVHPRPRVVYVPVSVKETAAKVPVPTVTDIPVATPPAPVKVTPLPPAPVEAKPSTQERVKNLVAHFLVVAGLIIVAAGVYALVGHAIGEIKIDPSAIQTMIMSGVGIVIGGINLQTSDYKGVMTMSNSGFTFSASTK